MPIDPVLNDLPEQNRRFKAGEQSEENRGRAKTEPSPIPVRSPMAKKDELRLTKKPPANPFEALMRFYRRRRHQDFED